MGTLFKGTKFFFSQRVPSRAHYIEQVKINGGEVVPLEKHADIKIVDHLSKDIGPGTHSYRYIERSVHNGALENLEDHQAGPPIGTIRSVGSVSQPAKVRRVPFTAEDDRILYALVDSCTEAGATSGNKIYMKLGTENPRHTWQSWRSRWTQHLKDIPRPAHIPRNAPPTPPTDPPREILDPRLPDGLHQSDDTQEEHFTDEDAMALVRTAEDFLNILPENVEVAWTEWAARSRKHSAQAWQTYWEEKIRPVYLRKKAHGPVEQKILQDVSDPSGSARRVIEKDALENETPIMLRSPSYRPGSPSRNSKSPSPSRQSVPSKKPRNILGKGATSKASEENGFEVPPLGTRVNDGRTPKRSRSTFEEELPHSSPLKSMVEYQSSKRGRYERMIDDSIEIPSTPEKTPTHGTAGAYMKVGHYIIDLESEDSADDATRRTGTQASQFPSEIERSYDGITHVARKDTADYLDFELPPPPDGWVLDEDENPEETFQQLEIIEAQPKFQDTQALFRDKTPAIDFSVADPDGGWSNSIPSSPPELPVSSQSVAGDDDKQQTNLDTADVNGRLDAWIDKQLFAGIALEHVELAMYCTTMDTSLAEAVLVSLADGDAIPRGVKGVWTKEDDADLYDEDARKLQALCEKHGQEGFDRRYEFRLHYDKSS